eukprot:724688-Pelagomonas_calceolata.AAC.1
MKKKEFCCCPGFEDIDIQKRCLYQTGPSWRTRTKHKSILLQSLSYNLALFLVAGPVFVLCLPCFSQSELVVASSETIWLRELSITTYGSCFLESRHFRLAGTNLANPRTSDYSYRFQSFCQSWFQSLMLVEKVSPAADQQESWAVGQSLVPLTPFRSQPSSGNPMASWK